MEEHLVLGRACAAQLDFADKSQRVASSCAVAAMAERLARLPNSHGRVELGEARRFAREQAVAVGAVTELSADRLFNICRRFERFAALGFDIRYVDEITPELVAAFIDALAARRRKPSPSTKRLRCSALRLWFRILREFRILDGDPTLDLVLPDRVYRRIRPLTDEEVERCQWAALATVGRTRQPAVWALAEAGASTSEIGHVSARDLDLAGSRVWLAGSPKTDARWAPLTAWGVSQIGRRLRDAECQPENIAYQGNGSDASRRTSVTEALNKILTRAGVHHLDGVGTRSVTLRLGARQLKSTGRIEDVALLLGLRSLDLAAELLGYDWRGTA